MRKCKLGEIAKFKTGPFGTQFKAAEYTQSGYPVINVKNIGIGRIIDNDIEFVSEKTRNRLSEHIIHEGDIVFARKGSVERHTYVRKEHDGWVQGSDCIKAKIDAGIEPRYVSYYLCLESVKKQLMLKAVGSTMPSMNTDILKDIAITLPDDEGVEKRIADFFDNINEKILSNEKIIATLESMAKTLYDYWFVQFDFPDANGRPYKTSGGKMEWNETLSREIPAGWEVIQLKDFAEVTQGNSPTGNTLNEENKGIAFYQGKTDFGIRFPIERIYTTEPYRYAEPMDTLLSVRAPVGAVNMAENKCCIGRGLAAIHQEKYPSLVYYMMMRLQPIFEKRGSGGTTFDSITKDDIKEVYICRPSKMYCECFEYKARAIDKQILNLSKENRKLASLREYLLPMLMNGQVTFRQ